ncbi:MAG: methyltransferase MtaB domain-containing protein [Spirochaetaceae bacterium]|nr:methyltransferase MtaB domain-containing protein [Spirochaetaceae bacterium]
MRISDSMAYGNPEEMIFGTARKPVRTKRGLDIGAGFVIPEIKPHPRPGSEKSLKTLLREFERASDSALERCVVVGHPSVIIEIEHVFQMTHTAKWGMEAAAQASRQIDDYSERYGLRAAYCSTVADIRKPDMVGMRDSDRTREVLEAFEACAPYSDIVCIESMGGKEVFDYSLIRNDIAGILFSQAVLGGRDMEWLWSRIVEIARRHGCVAGGDTDCSQANTAMFMAGGLLSKDVPHTLAALCRAIGAGRSLVAYECGATGPGKDCAYENPILKAIAGIPIATEGKTSACAHMSLCGNVMAATCDVWSNEAVEYRDMFGGTTPAVFTEMLGYDAAAMNSAIELGYQGEYQACLVNSDRYRGPQGFILCPDNAWEIGRAIVENGASLYSRARAAALTCGELMLGDELLRFTAFEKEALTGYLKDIEALPVEEGDFIDFCLGRYGKVRGFRPSSYGL